MRRFALLILVASALLLCALSPSPQPSPAPTPRPTGTQSGEISALSNHETTTNQQTASPSAVVTEQGNAARYIHKETKYAGQPTPPIPPAIIINNRDLVVEVATGVLAFVGLLQVILLAYTYGTNKRNAQAASANAIAAEKQVKALQEALVEARRTAEAAKKSADVAERALVDIERPHLLFENFKMGGFKKRIEGEEEMLKALSPVERMAQPRILRVTYRIKNYGKSPAWVVSSVVRFKIAVPRLEGGPDYGRYPQFVGYVLPAGEERTAERFLEGGALTEEWRLRIVGGQAVELVVYGFVDYTDIFQRSHRSAFAARYVVGGGSDPGDYFQPTGAALYWTYT
jgi:hypothetical protein